MAVLWKLFLAHILVIYLGSLFRQKIEIIKKLQCGAANFNLFRISTYSFDGDAAKIKARNNNRLVEVWMADVKHIYYAANQCT